LLGKPEWGLFTAPSIIEGYYPSRKLATWLDRFQLGLGYIVPEEESRSKCADLVAVHEQVNVSNVIWFENDDCCWRTSIEPLPHVSLSFWWSQRIENQPLAVRLNNRRCHDWFPTLIPIPLGVLNAPEPEAFGYIPKLDFASHRLHVV